MGMLLWMMEEQKRLELEAAAALHAEEKKEDKEQREIPAPVPEKRKPGRPKKNAEV